VSVVSNDLSTMFAALGGVRQNADRRGGVPLQDDSIMVLLQGSAYVFAYRKGHQRRHRIGELLPGSAVPGPLFQLDVIPESTAEFLRIPASALAAAASNPMMAEPLRQGFAKTLAGCGGTLSPKLSLADAAKRVTDELPRLRSASRMNLSVVGSPHARRLTRGTCGGWSRQQVDHLRLSSASSRL